MLGSCSDDRHETAGDETFRRELEEAANSKANPAVQL